MICVCIDRPTRRRFWQQSKAMVTLNGKCDWILFLALASDKSCQCEYNTIICVHTSDIDIFQCNLCIGPITWYSCIFTNPHFRYFTLCLICWFTHPFKLHFLCMSRQRALLLPLRHIISCVRLQAFLLNLTFGSWVGFLQVQCPPELLAPLVNMSKTGYKKMSAVYPLGLSLKIFTKLLPFHWSKTIERKNNCWH